MAKKDEHIEQLKIKHSVDTIYTIEVKGRDGKPIVAYFKKPSREIVGASLAISGRNPLSAKEMLLRACFLEGDKQILDDDEYFMGAAVYADDMIDIARATLKKN